MPPIHTCTPQVRAFFSVTFNVEPHSILLWAFLEKHMRGFYDKVKACFIDSFVCPRWTWVLLLRGMFYTENEIGWDGISRSSTELTKMNKDKSSLLTCVSLVCVLIKEIKVVRYAQMISDCHYFQCIQVCKCVTDVRGSSAFYRHSSASTSQTNVQYASHTYATLHTGCFKVKCALDYHNYLFKPLLCFI